MSDTKRRELAIALDGAKYGFKLTPREQELTESNGFIVITGESDDLIEIEGACSDEIGAYYPKTFYLLPNGSPVNTDELDEESAARICHGLPSVRGEYSDGGVWRFSTELPHETFRVYDDESLFCVGLIISLDDIKAYIEKGGSRHADIAD